jgi:hypothetical protein
MTTGFRLTLLCLMMLCLALCLTQPAEFDHLLPNVGAGSWFAICNRRAHRFGCQKHAISGARWSAAISGLQRYIDCGQYGSTRLGESWATGCDRRLGELPVRR